MDKISEAIGKMKNWKVPGPNGIPAENIEQTFSVAPQMLLSVLNNLLKDQGFSEMCITSKIILIPESQKTP